MDLVHSAVRPRFLRCVPFLLSVWLCMLILELVTLLAPGSFVTATHSLKFGSK